MIRAKSRQASTRIDLPPDEEGCELRLEEMTDHGRRLGPMAACNWLALPRPKSMQTNQAAGRQAAYVRAGQDRPGNQRRQAGDGDRAAAAVVAQCSGPAGAAVPVTGHREKKASPTTTATLQRLVTSD